MNVISISVDALISDIFSWHWDELPRSILKHLANIVNYNQVPDRVISDNEKVRDVVRWGRIDKMKMIRILIRCLDNGVEIMDEVKIEKYDYKIKHLIHLLKREPHYIEKFRIDIDKITTSEAAIVLSLGEKYFLDKIDLSKYKFNFKESMNIIQGYKYDREIIKQVNYKSLKGYQIAEILTHTGDNNIDLLDISTLTNIDWVNLLSYRPELLSSCNFSKFLSGDIFYSIKLCCMFDKPDLSYLVLDRNVNDISPFGWEKLLIEKPEIFLAHCNFDKLDDNNWSNILKSQPDLYVYKVN
jgi:hypothetical protein